MRKFRLPLRMVLIYYINPIAIRGFAMTDPIPAPHVEPAAARPAAAPPVLDARHLLQGSSSVLLSYQGQAYRLSVTKAGKLILTK